MIRTTQQKIRTTLLTVGLMIASLPTMAEQVPERIPLWPGPAPVDADTTEKANAFISVYHPEKANGTAIIVCPGGGYRGLVKKSEGTRIATWLNENGIVAVVLEYRLPKGKPHRPLYDVQRTIRFLRSRAGEWNCDAKRIGVIGFSAGGHLASAAATHFDHGQADATDPLDRLSSRPDFAILVYPVITMGPGTHGGSKNNLLGKDPTPEAIKLFSNELQVSANTPPTFLAHAADDGTVPPENSRLFYDALIANGVPAKYLKLPRGGHGLNGYKGPMWDAWQTQSLEWISALKTAP
jgi:acetyl esterase/lipase